MKLFIYLGVFVGGLIGGYIPVWLFNASFFSAWGIIGSALGSIVGIWAGYQLYQNYGE